jgi:hypothetical protein
MEWKQLSHTWFYVEFFCCSGHLGGKLGKSLVEDLGVNTPGDLLQFSQLKLQELYGVNTGYICFILLCSVARATCCISTWNQIICYVFPVTC